ncbi:MAG: gliding motility-associated C-terminal domain-containing protein [Ferruginibacter sp.]
MRPYLYPILACLFSLTVSAQSPGGISAGNILWLKSDAGLTTSGNTVSQWQDFSGTNVTGNFTVQPLSGTGNTQTGPTKIDAGINFNPYLRFNGITNSLSSVNLFAGSSLVNNNRLTVFQVFNLKGGLVWLQWETDQAGATARLGYQNSNGNIRFDYPKVVPASAGQNIGTINVLDKNSLSTTYANNGLSVNRLNGANNTSFNIPAPGNFADETNKMVIGNSNLENLPAQVDIAEVIVYSTLLNFVQRNTIESYLAIKYGFTLDQAGTNPNNYIASDGGVMWNSAANNGYNNDITGIAEDDASGLNQRQSKSINPTALITIYNGDSYGTILPVTNAENDHFFYDDRNFLLAGDNGGDAFVKECFFNGKAEKMQRAWKVNTSVGNFPSLISVEEGNIPVLDKYIIVSPDPTFPINNTSFYPLITSGGRRFADVLFNNNDYFSFATDTLIIHVMLAPPPCSTPNAGSITVTASSGIPPYSYSWSLPGQNTSDLVNVAQGIYTLTVTQDGCQYTQDIILHTPGAPDAPLIFGVSACPNEQKTLYVNFPNPSYIYKWYDTPTGGNLLGTGPTFTTPPVTGGLSYYVEATSGICSSLRSLITVTLTPTNFPVIHDTTICSGNFVTLTIQNPDFGYLYNWYYVGNQGDTIPFASGTSVTTATLYSTTTYYVDGNLLCLGYRVPVVITIIKPPAAKDVEVCPGNIATLSVENPDATLTYSWYSVSTGGTALANGTTFTTPPVFAATTFYLEVANSFCGDNGRVPVHVTMIPVLDTPRVRVTNITGNSVSFGWPPVAGAIGYEVSVDGGPYSSPSSGSTGLTHTIINLPRSHTVTIRVVANGQQPCEKSNPGRSKAGTYGNGFYIPSAFTPNGDNLNDMLTPIYPLGSTLDYFTIYNRWGQKVFSTSEQGAGWNGKLQGIDQPIGSYVWICRYRVGPGTIIDEKGTVTIFH